MHSDQPSLHGESFYGNRHLFNGHSFWLLSIVLTQKRHSFTFWLSLPIKHPSTNGTNSNWIKNNYINTSLSALHGGRGRRRSTEVEPIGSEDIHWKFRISFPPYKYEQDK